MLKCHSAKEAVSQVLEDLKGTSSSKPLCRTFCDIKWWKLTETEWRFVNYKIRLQRVKKKKWKFHIHISSSQPRSLHCSWHSCTIDHIWHKTTIKVLAIPWAVINPEEGIYLCYFAGSFPCVRVHMQIFIFMSSQFMLWPIMATASKMRPYIISR